MRNNPIKQTLAAGGVAYGTMAFEFFTPNLAQICAAAGAEFLLYDMEHSGLGFDALKTQFVSVLSLQAPMSAAGDND